MGLNDPNDLNNNFIPDDEEAKGIEKSVTKMTSKPFKLRSGNTAPFKMLGSSPAKIWGGSLMQQRQEEALQQSIGQQNLQKPVDPFISGGDNSVVGNKADEGVMTQTDPEGNVPTPQENAQKIDHLAEEVRQSFDQVSQQSGGNKPKGNLLNVFGSNAGGGNAPQVMSDVKQTASKVKMPAVSSWAKKIFSDIRLKEKIEKTGASPSGIPIYEFNYIGDNNRYSGAMAQDLLEMNIDAVSMDASGYYKVNYNNIDVDMHLIN